MQDANEPTPGPEQRVAMLVQGDEVYGVGTVLKLYAEHMPALRFVCFKEGPMQRWLQDAGREVHVSAGMAKFIPGSSARTLLQLPARLSQARADAAAVEPWLRDRKIEAVHTHWLPQQLIGGFLRRRGFRTLWHVHNNMSIDRLFGLGKKMNHALARWGADRILPVSDFIGANYHGCGVPIQTIHNTAETAEAVTLRRRSTLGSGDPLRLVAAGRLEESKGHHVAVEALGRLKRSGIDVRLDVFGGPSDGNPYADRLRRRIADLGLEEVVTLCGFVNNLRARHADYDLGLQNRIDPEPCSMWVLETMMDGLPLVASASGGTPELIEDAVTGRLYPPNDADMLAGCIRAIAEDRPWIFAASDAAAARGRDLFSVERFVARTRSVYLDLLGHAPTGVVA